MPDAPPTPSVWPTLQARDARGLVAFLTDVVGFVATAVMAGDDRDVAHAQLDWPHGGGVMLGSHSPDREWSREPGTCGTYVVVPDDEIDALHARLRERAAPEGGRVVVPLRDTDYGTRELVLQDPEGNLWSFGTYRGEPRR
ncbi:glyoxalase [Cellulosimicrobium cellulans]|uniref:Glyoxalase n=1 Tax=Cellulosimicrobium cellulans TaxID=1710 RepID=A0A1Y0I1R3_CELCE|nr:glyoxalase [Cellulosimicrobium cellulans]